MGTAKSSARLMKGVGHNRRRSRGTVNRGEGVTKAGRGHDPRSALGLILGRAQGGGLGRVQGRGPRLA